MVVKKGSTIDFLCYRNHGFWAVLIAKKEVLQEIAKFLQLRKYACVLLVIYTKQKYLGYKKSARPIRSSIANRYVRPKTLISFEAKKLLIKNLFHYLNDIQ